MVRVGREAEEDLVTNGAVVVAAALSPVVVDLEVEDIEEVRAVMVHLRLVSRMDLVKADIVDEVDIEASAVMVPLTQAQRMDQEILGTVDVEDIAAEVAAAAGDSLVQMMRMVEGAAVAQEEVPASVDVAALRLLEMRLSQPHRTL